MNKKLLTQAITLGLLVAAPYNVLVLCQDLVQVKMRFFSS